MKKLKFKHPTKDEPIEVLMKLYSIGVYADHVTKKLEKLVDLFSNNDFGICDVKSGHNGPINSFKLNCDSDYNYSVIWQVKNDEISDELAREIAIVLHGEDDIDFFRAPGGIRTFFNKNISNLKQATVFFNKTPNSNDLISIMTGVDIEQHPLMIQLYREKRLGDILD